MQRIVIYCPKGAQTGGPEALHQLYKALLDLGANVILKPFAGTSRQDEVQAYNIYQPKWLKFSFLKRTDILIVPEVTKTIPISMILFLKRTNIYCWWLSVDNSWIADLNMREIKRYPLSRQWRFTNKVMQAMMQDDTLNNSKLKFNNRLQLMKTYLNPILIFNKLRNVIFYFISFPLQFYRKIMQVGIPINVKNFLYQSEYARLTVQDYFKTTSGIMLSDYISDLNAIDSRQQNNEALSRIVIAYNWAKSRDFIEVLRSIDTKSEFDFIPIKGLSPREIQHLFKEAFCYLDLGHFPGKDRLPREAILNFCPVFLGKRGAARNSVDFELAEKYRIDMNQTSPTELLMLLKNEFHQGKENLLIKQMQFRKQVMQERGAFYREVETLIRHIELN